MENSQSYSNPFKGILIGLALSGVLVFIVRVLVFVAENWRGSI